jgi:hypothetical protein
VNGDPGDDHSTALKMDEKQHVVGRQPAQRQHLGREKVGPVRERSDEEVFLLRLAALGRGC